MANYYADGSASTNGDGSFASPWNNLPSINNHTFSTSDCLYFKVGTTIYLNSRNDRTICNWSGTAINPAIIGAYYGDGLFGLNGNARPIIDGRQQYPASYQGAIEVLSQSYVTIKDLTVQNTGDSDNRGMGLRVASSDFTNIKNCYIYYTSGTGMVYSGNGGEITDNVLEQAKRLDLPGTGAAMEITGANVDDRTKNLLIARNKVFLSAHEGIGLYKKVTGCIVEHNIVRDTRSYMIYMDASGNNTIRYNLIYLSAEMPAGRKYAMADNLEPSRPYCFEGGNEFYGNLIAGANRGISFGNGKYDECGARHIGTKVYNNTFVGCDYSFQFWVMGSGDSIDIKNNISIIESSDGRHVSHHSPAGVNWSHNLFYGGPSVTGNAATNAITSNPLITKPDGWRTILPDGITINDFKLLSGSPAIDAGIAVTTVLDTYDSDAWGTSIPQGAGPDIGAHEYSTGSIPDPTNPPAQFTYDPSSAATASNPISTASFSIENITVGAIDTSSIVETTTPWGTKVWRFTDAEKGNRFIKYDDVPANSLDCRVLVIWRADQGFAGCHCIPAGRVDFTSSVDAYTGGLVSDTHVRSRRFEGGNQTSIGTSALHGITSTVNTWICSEFDISTNTLRGRSWEYGEEVPDWQYSVSDNVHSEGSAGFQLWINGVDFTSPSLDIAWLSVGTEGGIPEFPEETSQVKTVCYSFSPFGTGDLKTGDCEITINTPGEAVLSIAQTGNIGVGDKITYNTTSVVFISKVYSSTRFDVITATGGTPPNCVNLTVNSIAHAFNSLSAALTGASDANHLNTLDLVTGKYFLRLAQYRDHSSNAPEATLVNVPAFVTDSNQYIEWFTPRGLDYNESLLSQRHPGYIKAAPDYAHCRFSNASGASVTISGIEKFVVDGVEIQNTELGADQKTLLYFTGSFSGAVHEIKNTIISTPATDSTPQTEGICYSDISGSSVFTLLIEQCNVLNLPRFGLAIYDVASLSYTLNINSSSFYKCGSLTSDLGNINIQKDQDTSTIAVNVFNSVLMSGIGSDVEALGTYIGDITWNVANCIDSDNTLIGKDLSALECLASRTATDSSSPGAGNWVMFNNITTLPYDLRLQKSYDNDAFEMHQNSDGLGVLNVPILDIAGTIRPQGDGYDCGSSESFDLSLAAPSNVQVVVNSNTSASVSWNQVTGAAGYQAQARVRAYK